MGIYEFADGVIYTSEWRCGRRCGAGVASDPLGNMVIVLNDV